MMGYVEAMTCPLDNMCMLMQPSKTREAKHIRATFAATDYVSLELVNEWTVMEEAVSLSPQQQQQQQASPGSARSKRKRKRHKAPVQRRCFCRMGAHRFVCWSRHGPPPSRRGKWVVMHSCDNPDCVNGSHVTWGRDKENNVYPPI